MENITQHRTKNLMIRLTSREFERIKDLSKKAGARSIAEYIRNKSLGRRTYKKSS